MINTAKPLAPREPAELPERDNADPVSAPKKQKDFANATASILGALTLGPLVYVFSTCGFGQFVSTFTKTQA